MAQFEAKIIYLKGTSNTVADSLSRYPTVSSSSLAELTAPFIFDDSDNLDPICTLFWLEDVSSTSFGGANGLSRTPVAVNILPAVATILSITTDSSLLKQIREGYSTDPWCQKLLSASKGMTAVENKNGLWYLIIPRVLKIRECLFRLAHDALGDFGFDKSYAALRSAYYWPNMRRDLESAYIPSCTDCMRNKCPTSKKPGPLHPLPVPNDRADSVAIDFIGPLPEDNGFNCIVSMTDRLGADVQIKPCRTDMSAEDFAVTFFDAWYCENGLPLDIFSDRDKLFMSMFWRALHKLTGVNLKMSTSYHPQTDGASERTNC